jgi:hypothetical protein
MFPTDDVGWANHLPPNALGPSLVGMSWHRFHVDNYSSAHVYLRLPKGMTIDTIHPDTIQECFQLVKVHAVLGRAQF